jgi:hypothetical protein
MSQRVGRMGKGQGREGEEGGGGRYRKKNE